MVDPQEHARIETLKKSRQSIDPGGRQSVRVMEPGEAYVVRYQSDQDVEAGEANDFSRQSERSAAPGEVYALGQQSVKVADAGEAYATGRQSVRIEEPDDLGFMNVGLCMPPAERLGSKPGGVQDRYAIDTCCVLSLLVQQVCCASNHT